LRLRGIPDTSPLALLATPREAGKTKRERAALSFFVFMEVRILHRKKQNPQAFGALGVCLL